MKKALLITIVITTSFACKTKQKATNSIDNPLPQAEAAPVNTPKTKGSVSHKYKNTGCTTVLIVKLEGEQNPLTLIPSEPLSKTIDMDGKEIMFDYRLLKMPNPPGCNVGIPAEITNIKLK